ncbi:hypothetical protein HYALB_00010123 [Hymenoscyphus albidus]|uniref:AAA+ ATPase domain-containing protein n=1 Tax=Hymenoscyphus albidus TaxID=595503 RepID=A0A9N9LCA2_9HELO|nr:hypothetical protein HYALB_00010123 [Hymenoscyphus albidus]
MQCDIKNLYQLEDARGRISWTDQYPADVLEAAENEVTARFAILVRNKKSFDSRKKLEIHSIVVQSPLLKNVLVKDLKNYPGVTVTLKRLEFGAPLNPFVHRWSELKSALAAETHEETKSHLQLLYSILEAELKDIIAARNDHIENQVITFSHLWTIFQPDRRCALKFTQGDYTKHPKYGPCYSLAGQRVDWDGDRFGYAHTQHLIPSFGGTLPISELEVFPLEFHPNQRKIRAKLIKRGKVFEKYHGYHYQSYKAFALGKNHCGQDIKVTVDSRIIIDTFAFGKFNPNRVPVLSNLTLKSKSETSEHDSHSSEQFSDDSDDYDDLPNGTGVQMLDDSKRIPLNDEQLTHCAIIVKGYALKIKQWLSFFVDEVKPIVWSDSAFSSLVLPPAQKEIIRAFVSAQTKYKDNFDDVISGKGKGITMLLSSGPGIGKTLTAESVAEDMKVPLYMMSAGDLGVNSAEVEKTLTTILEMVAKWNAVLLLDECDVFLEARSAHDLERNKIVSIFLRTLEYYEGILFLTTNRVKNMDPAFQSRIHIRLSYPPLSKSSRTQVWNNFLSRGIAHEINPADVDKLAEVQINGREIKNILKTAQFLSQHQELPLRYDHLKTVLDVEQGFGVEDLE